MSEAVLLRTLTEKSKLQFGKYRDYRIGDMLKLRTTKNYLIWLYYNASMINFSDSVLTALWIHEEERIKKPGVKKNEDQRIIKKAKNFLFAKAVEKKGWKYAISIKNRNKKRQKAKLFLSELRAEKRNNKSVLAEKNRNGISPSVKIERY